MSRPDPEPKPEPGPEPGKSFGNMGPDHWSVARKDENQEALAYYRERSHAPGVEQGGGPRNFYCMHCDGVIPAEPEVAACPHCGEALTGVARRYFNWVELDKPVKSDVRALLPLAVGGAVLLIVVAVVLVWLLA